MIISTIVDRFTRSICSPRVYTDLIISTIVDGLGYSLNGEGLYGLDNFYYRRYKTKDTQVKIVYTDLIISTIVDRGSVSQFARLVYTDLIISTIVDCASTPCLALSVYTDLIISTIVDCICNSYSEPWSIRT